MCLCISLLTWYPRSPSMPSIGGWYSLPVTEARGALGAVPSGLRATLNNYLSSLHLIFSGPSSCLPYFIPSVYKYLSPSESYNPVSSPISSSTCAALISRISREGCSHHLQESRTPGLQSTTRHNSMIGRVVMYCTTVFWR